MNPFQPDVTFFTPGSPSRASFPTSYQAIPKTAIASCDSEGPGVAFPIRKYDNSPSARKNAAYRCFMIINLPLADESITNPATVKRSLLPGVRTVLSYSGKITISSQNNNISLTAFEVGHPVVWALQSWISKRGAGSKGGAL